MVAFRRISIHALREEGDFLSLAGSEDAEAFLSTPSARRATEGAGIVVVLGAISIHALREEGDIRFRPVSTTHCNFYPRPPRGGRLVLSCLVSSCTSISIHALREEGDLSGLGFLGGFCDFYPRPPRGGRLEQKAPAQSGKRFLSTPSARRATRGCGADLRPESISIHALREEGDTSTWVKHRTTTKFLSTPSARRATLSTSSGS